MTLPVEDNVSDDPCVGPSRAEVIVCERTGKWAVRLRRELSRARIPMHEARAVAQCRRLLADAPASFVVLEISRRNADEALSLVARGRGEFPAARFAVVTDRAMRAIEPLAREAGAVHYTASPRQAAPLASLALRHVRSIPEVQRAWRRQVWDRLPWKMARMRRPDESD